MSIILNVMHGCSSCEYICVVRVVVKFSVCMHFACMCHRTLELLSLTCLYVSVCKGAAAFLCVVLVYIMPRSCVGARACMQASVGVCGTEAGGGVEQTGSF